MIIKRDKYYFAVDVPLGSQIVVNGVTVSLTAGTYWTHNDAGVSNHPSFYIMLKSRLAAVIGGTWEVYPIAPAGYPVKSGIRLRRVSGGSFTALNLSTSPPMIKRLLGFRENQSGVITVTGNQLDGPVSAYGSWSPYSLFEGRATYKDSTMQRVTAWSTDHPEVATAIVWRERKIRTIRYEYVFGTSVFDGRNNYDQLVEYSERALNDRNNTLQNLWDVAGRDLQDIIVVYDLDELDLNITTHEYEYVKLGNQRMAESMDNIAKRSQIAGDFWQVDLALVVVGGNGYGL